MLLDDIGRRGSDKEAIAAKVARSPAALAQVFEGLSAAKANLKYGCAKVLEVISERNPQVLYPKFDRFVELLGHSNKILQWEAIRIIASLSDVDSKNKVEKILDTYSAPIGGPVMITAANVIKGAAKIALAKPHLTGRIVRKFLSVEKGRYQTGECRNVILGHAIEGLELLFEQIEDRKPVLRFVRRQEKNTRNATRRKAERFLRKHHQ